MQTIGSFHETLDRYGDPIRSGNYRKELSNSTEAKCLRIRMMVVDSQNCFGPQVNVTLPVAMHITSQGNVSLMDYLLTHRRKSSHDIVFLSIIPKSFCYNCLPIDLLRNSFAQITYQLILICVAVSFVTLAAVMLVIYVLVWKNRKKNIVNYWRGLYQNVQHE